VTRAVVLADTHLRRGWNRRLPGAVYDHLAEADAVLHAGDLVIPELLHELSGFAPVHAVLGNNDGELFGALPETVEVDVDGVRIAMIHDSGARIGRERRMHARFPAADVVVFGHSHEPVDAPGEGGQRLFNPGSPTERRRAPTRTIGLLDLAAGRIVDHRIVEVD
jgi:putative phosphoesterase